MVAPVPIIQQVKVVIPGSPVAQGRGRAVPTARGIRVKDPDRSKGWKIKARTCMRMAMRSRSPLLGPLHVEVWFCYVLGRSLKTRARWKDTLPDSDNLQKALFDAGNGVLWMDDGQIARVVASKVVDRKGSVPRVLIAVRSLLDSELVMPEEATNART